MIKEILLKQDANLFISINHLPHNVFLNSFFSFLSGIGSWGMIWVVIALALFIWEEGKNQKKLVALVLAVILSALFVELGLKNIVRRLRPEFIIPFTIVIADKTASYSFPSEHATLAFAGAYILGREHKRLKWFYYLLAILISFSRIYLGKHYPSDVIAGAVIGLIIGFISLKVATRISKYFN